MKIYHGLNDSALKKKPRSIAIGVFDGVHRGHAKILKHAITDAKKSRRRSMVITFDPDPSRVLRPNVSHPILMSLAHRLRAFKAMGISETLVIRFNKQFSKLNHETFLRKILYDQLNMRSLVVGHDFCFGKKAKGNIDYLKKSAAKLQFKFKVIEPLKDHGHIISSTQIRNLIERGDLTKATKMLGRPVSVFGTVIHGRSRGKTIGFPTANLNPHHETLPPDGVYAVQGVLNKHALKGVVNIGARPTFADREKSLEAHFLNFKGNLYGKDVELIFSKRLRGICKFSSPDKLATAIELDIQKAQKLFKNKPRIKP